MLLPFAFLLGAIALGPLVSPVVWARRYPYVAWSLGGVTLLYYLLGLNAGAEVSRIAHEYISFIALVGSLFVVAGGIHIQVKGGSTPASNVVFLLLGAAAANLLGTTGAAMLLLGPWIRMNRSRISEHHTVFFIFIVANIGGCLTPIGDPPLFLGYLQGVPFWWVTRHCWPMWAVGMAFLLSVFYVIDLRSHRSAMKAVSERPGDSAGKWCVQGLRNLVWLAMVLASVFISHPLFLREGVMLLAALASYFTTRKEVRQANQFTFHPLREVAVLFSGIFATMMPALDWLQTQAPRWGAPTASLFYWASGGLSACLDNAPTYLSFLSAAQGSFAPPGGHSFALPMANVAFAKCLLAVSIGSVFFGAATYIGNGPNFMIKAIAAQEKTRPPGFLRFITHYSLPFLAPLLALVWWLFFRT